MKTNQLENTSPNSWYRKIKYQTAGIEQKIPELTTDKV